jgi:predicted CXXCH cytochrome family protein
MNKTLLTFPVLLAWLLFSTAIIGADHKCTDCHNSESPSTNDLNKPISALCVDCHAARIAAGEHKVDIAVNALGKTPNITLPLQGGKLTCVTCHDPHQTSLALRLPTNELCMQCHKK